MTDCEAFSQGCFFKLMCHSPCVCPEWKRVRCGGEQSGDPSECSEGKHGQGNLLEKFVSNHTLAALMLRAESVSTSRTSLEQQSEKDAKLQRVESLDEVISGKRCRR